MSWLVKINGTSLPVSDCLSVSSSEQSLEFAGSKLISSKITIELQNHGYVYDDRVGTGGIFETLSWYNKTVLVYDNETDELIWEGRLKKIQVDDNKKITKLTVNDYIQELVDTVCVVNLLNVTAADAIYAILTDSSRLNIPESRLIMSGFEIGISQHQDRKFNITYTATANQKCIAVLEEICRITNSHLFQKENKIGFWAWSDYTGVLGTPVTSGDILPGSYSQESEDSKILNEFSVVWKNGTSVSYATDTDSVSAALYGSGKLFAVPSDEVDSSSASDFNILFVSQAAANDAIASIKARYANLQKYCSITVKSEFSFVALGDVLDLKFSPFVREPVRVTGIKPDRKNKTYELTCEYINYPATITLDLTLPGTLQMYEPLYFEGSVYLRWSSSPDAGVIMYKLYFSSSEGYWGKEFSNGRFSPVTIPVSSLDSVNTDCLFEFSPVDAGKTLYFRVSAIDNAFNESLKSNKVKITVPSAAHAAYENRFNLAGNPLQGFTLDITNPGAGEGLVEWAEYDEAEFDSDVFAPTAVYESALLRKTESFALLQYRAICDRGDIQMQYRSFSDVFGPWSDLQNAEILGIFGIPGEYIQYRVIFNSPRWSDTDKFIVKEII